MKDRLFACILAGQGITYCDTSKEEHGDYVKVAFLSFRDLELTIYKPRSPLVARIQEDAKLIQARKGEQYQTASSGQTITLGWGLK